MAGTAHPSCGVTLKQLFIGELFPVDTSEYFVAYFYLKFHGRIMATANF
jgi:uncharacterized ParB-like nuclease family protein